VTLRWSARANSVTVAEVPGLGEPVWATTAVGTNPAYTSSDIAWLSSVLALLIVFVITGLSVTAQRRGSTDRRREVLVGEALTVVDWLLAIGPAAPDTGEVADRIRDVQQRGDQLTHTLGQVAAMGELGEARLAFELQQRAQEFITMTVDGLGGRVLAHHDLEVRYVACRQRFIAARTAFVSRSRRGG
jgi:hypothetical protein